MKTEGKRIGKLLPKLFQREENKNSDIRMHIRISKSTLQKFTNKTRILILDGDEKQAKIRLRKEDYF